MSSHLKALLKKNWLQAKRNWCCTILEIVFPSIFVFAFVLIRQADPPEDIEKMSHISEPFTFLDTYPSVQDMLVKNCRADENGGKIALSPPGDAIITQLDTIFTNLGFETMMFDNRDAMDDFVIQEDYATPEKRLCFGVVVEKNVPNQEYSYSLRFNVTVMDPDIPPPNDILRVNTIFKEDLTSLEKYAESGYLAIQHLIDNIILKTETSSTAKIKADVSSVSTPPYRKDTFKDNFRQTPQFVLVIPLLLPYLRMVSRIVGEKEKRIKEGMKIMGLRSDAFYLSWFITYFIIFTLCSLLVSLTFCLTFFTRSNFFLIFLWHWEECMAMLAMGLFTTVFFSRAKVANATAFFISLGLGLVEKYIRRPDESESTKIWGSLAPGSSIAVSFFQIVHFEAGELGLNSDTVNLFYMNYRVYYHYIGMLIVFIIFISLAVYLEQVIPGEFGISKHPLFCLMRKKKQTDRQVHDMVPEETTLNDPNFEETDPALKAQDKNNESIRVINLKKVYPNGKLAVDGVSYSMYQGQIFALLGHNGAGKTSTINMITGLYPATFGTVSVFGMDIHQDLDQIRKIMGVCPQHDVLFEDLTVEEHLELFAIFKGADKSNLQAEIDKIIEDLDLKDKRDYQAKHLSGGQRRKLCIGIAFIGGSKFILLDEPSSGMDTSARRRLWDMLKNYKHGKVILLTTHYMDEADYLGDRIAIMGEGKIKCLGRPLFLKNRFGVGYSLTIVKNSITDPSKPILEYVQGVIPESKVTSNVSAEISLQLPIEAAPKFKRLFEGLDKNLKELCISSYGVSVTTLEEVFLNVSKISTSLNTSEKGAKQDPLQREDQEEFDLEKERIRSWSKLFTTHFVALVRKRYQYFLRDRKGLMMEILLPIIMVVIGIAFSKGQIFMPPVPLPVTNRFYGEVNNVAYNTRLPDNSVIDPVFLQGFDPEDFHLSPVDLNVLSDFDEFLYNDKERISGWRKFSFFVKTLDNSADDYYYHALIDTRAHDASPFALNKINQAIIRYASARSDLKINTKIDAFPRTKGTASIENTLSSVYLAFIFAIGMAFIPAGITTYIVKERETNVKHQQLISGVTLAGYWFSNYFVDVVKYFIPAIVCAVLANLMDAQPLIEGPKYGALWGLFISYGFCITSFTYLTSFLFKDFGQAQSANYFGHFISGFVISMTVSVLRLIEATSDVAKVIHWILRLSPSFSLTYGFLNLANLEAFDRVEKNVEPTSPWDVNRAGGDVYALLITSVVYLVLLFVVEAIRGMRCFPGFSRGDTPYAQVETDDDVQEELNRIEKADPSQYSVIVRNIRKVFHLDKNRQKVAVNRVSFGIKNGECFALLGVNGAGKTTTFKMLTGELLPTKGDIFINGYRVPSQIHEARKYIGYCPQFDALLDNLTAREHLELYATIKGIPKEKKEQLIVKQLDQLNLTKFEHVPAGTYSGGNKRKLSVAIAMIGNPPIVFLDEPSNGMDPEARRFMWNVISRISTERKQSSVILTTHSMEEAEALATKIGIQVDGNLKCLGSAQHLKNKYGGGFEIEIKTNLPGKDQIKNLVSSLGYNLGIAISKEQVLSILEKVGALDRLSSQLNEHGSGSAISLELKNKTKVPIEIVAEWILIEQKGFQIESMIKRHVGSLTLIEHFQSFYRYKTSSDISIGKIFGLFEENKEVLNIMQYSVKQTSLEQIFNAFANNAIEYEKKQPEDQQIKITVDS